MSLIGYKNIIIFGKYLPSPAGVYYFLMFAVEIIEAFSVIEHTCVI
jgi:hypothetical protein